MYLYYPKSIVYISYPVILPTMAFGLCYLLMSFFKKLRSYQQIVDEIWLDKSGSEIRVIYRNKKYRVFRGKPTYEMLITTTLLTPDEDKQLMKGNIKV
jgi:hypothetical protein